MLWIKNEFIYLKNKHFYCLDDYIDHFITVHENEDVKVIGLYGKFAYIIKNKRNRLDRKRIFRKNIII